MKKQLFGNDIVPACTYCSHSKKEGNTQFCDAHKVLKNGKAKKITSLQLKNCNFTGNIPESYANLPSTCNQLFINGNKLQGVIPASVQAHANWTKWKPETNILPQQEGFGLSLE